MRQWQMPIAMAAGASVVYKNKLICIGGTLPDGKPGTRTRNVLWFNLNMTR